MGRAKRIPVTVSAAVAKRQAANGAKASKASHRRRLIDPTTCQRDYTDDDREFMVAVDRYKRESHRPFPTLSELLEVLRGLGYRKVGQKAGA